MVKAEIEVVSRVNYSVNLDFMAQNNQWVLNSEDLSLEPGLYRIKVQTDNTSEDAPNAVHNLFEVADINT